MKHPEYARPLLVHRRQAAQGQLDAGEDRLLPAAGELFSISAISSTSDARVASTPRLRRARARSASVRA